MSATAQEAKQWLTVNDLEAETGFAKQTFYNWRTEGKGPRAHLVGGHRLRYSRADVDAWLAEQREDG